MQIMRFIFSRLYGWLGIGDLGTLFSRCTAAMVDSVVPLVIICYQSRRYLLLKKDHIIKSPAQKYEM